MNDEDPIIKNHQDEARSGFSEDAQALVDKLRREYPSPESAIEDYRRGYVTEEQLKMRFTDEEMELVYREVKERDKEDEEGASAVSHL